MAVLSRLLLAAAAAALGVSASTVTMNFDDVLVSNDEACTETILNQKNGYHGFTITTFEGNVSVLNSTMTPNCPLGKEDTSAHPMWSTSGSNVLYNSAGYLKFKPQGSKKITKSSFDVDLIFYPNQLFFNSTVKIETTLSNGKQELYVYSTLDDGFGPYHIEVNGAPSSYVIIDALAIMPIGEGPTVNTDLVIDNAVFELS
ncbi:hypothetical protein Trco_002715 [Trichoderma cornu-damae]|uniref:Uncharacterized protein n=1 Tax=Trichoderma cornu-damae TaxID=654480 RepID=A0A9P8TZD8_9HYPO|nr:hypothetical protein Trco_002715 [Trichoderma cornu-damae]